MDKFIQKSTTVIIQANISCNHKTETEDKDVEVIITCDSINIQQASSIIKLLYPHWNIEEINIENV